MAKLYKVEMYVLDTNDDYTDLEEILDSLECSTEAFFKPFNTQVAEFNWDDNIDINSRAATVEDFRRYFK